MHRTEHPLEVLSAAFQHALLEALPDVCVEAVDYAQLTALPTAQRRALLSLPEDERWDKLPHRVVPRRPLPQECRVRLMFVQAWGSTALGFGGVAGQAVTQAYTVVVEGPEGDCAVYWDGRLGYSVPAQGVSDEQGQAFQEDLRSQWTAPRREAAARYGAILPEPSRKSRNPL